MNLKQEWNKQDCLIINLIKTYFKSEIFESSNEYSWISSIYVELLIEFVTNLFKIYVCACFENDEDLFIICLFGVELLMFQEKVNSTKTRSNSLL